MSRISEIIRESVLRSRLKESGCLVVYGADKRYSDQCFELTAEKIPGGKVKEV